MLTGVRDERDPGRGNGRNVPYVDDAFQDAMEDEEEENSQEHAEGETTSEDKLLALKGMLQDLFKGDAGVKDSIKDSVLELVCVPQVLTVACYLMSEEIPTAPNLTPRLVVGRKVVGARTKR